MSRDKTVQNVHNDWEWFCLFVAFYIMKINLRLRIHTRDNAKCEPAEEKTEFMENSVEKIIINKI
jgi:hypothetical protein